MSTVWLLNDVAEFKGKQESFTNQAPQALKALRDAAMVQSAESSNRIEGVTIHPDRLQPLVLGQSKPRDRSEQEVQGYRRALNDIHIRHADLSIRRIPPAGPGARLSRRRAGLDTHPPGEPEKIRRRHVQGPRTRRPLARCSGNEGSNAQVRVVERV